MAADVYEMVQQSPETIYRKVFEDRNENNSKNEYYYMKDEFYYGPYTSISLAVQARKEHK